MAFHTFPALNLPFLPLQNVLRHCSIEDLLSLSILSARTENAINASLIRTKRVEIGFSHLRVVLLNDSEVHWKFVTDPESLINPKFSDLLISYQINGGTSYCAHSKQAMTTVFRKFKKLFKIDKIALLEICVTGNLQKDPILQRIQKCETVKMWLGNAVCEKDLEWFFGRITVEDTFCIDSGSKGAYIWDKPFSTAKCVIYEGHGHTFNPTNLFNCTHIHFQRDFRSPSPLNQLIKNWQHGRLPNLRIIEHSGMSTDEQFMGKLLEGLGSEEWDTEREKTFNMNLFFTYAKLKTMTRSLHFRQGRDITRFTDGMKASIIPNRRALHLDDFVFVVWSDWIPGQFRRPSKTPYVPMM